VIAPLQRAIDLSKIRGVILSLKVVDPMRMRSRVLVSLSALVAVSCVMAAEWKSGINWREPTLVEPGDATKGPSDAIVLFDGKNMDEWNGGDKWKLEDGYGLCLGGVSTKKKFGDCQLHIEFATPEKVEGDGQGRGNSGVYLMGRYEVQILDSYINKTYFDGQCAAMYKQHPPLVNACRKPGEWQTYDIIFHAPKFRPDGSLKSPATVTVLQNGVLVQDHYELLGPTDYEKPPLYSKHDDRDSISLQYHGNPVRFRNIWIRDLAPVQSKGEVAGK
jgi:hypothetical protein